MKKVTYLMTILFAVALMSTSCCKDDPVPELTLEEQYPEWSDLSWVSTNGSTSEYPQLDLIIINDVATLTETEYVGAPVNGEVPYSFIYEEIVLTTTHITFNEPDIGGTERTYEILTPDTPGTKKLQYDGNVFILE